MAAEKQNEKPNEKKVTPAAGFRGMVQRRHPSRRAGGLFAGARQHGVSSRRLRHLGAAARRARPAHQEDRRAQRVLSAPHPAKLPAKGGEARRGLRARGRGRHPRRRQAARGAADRAADQRDHHQSYVRAVDPFASRFADDGESMVQRGAMGDAHAAVPAHARIPVAGRAYGARDAGGGRARDPHDAGGLPTICRGVPRDSADRRAQERGRTISRRR